MANESGGDDALASFPEKGKRKEQQNSGVICSLFLPPLPPPKKNPFLPFYDVCLVARSLLLPSDTFNSARQDFMEEFNFFPPVVICLQIVYFNGSIFFTNFPPHLPLTVV